jgi:hypothetical protein
MQEVKIGDWLKEGFEAVKSDVIGYALPALIIFGVCLTVIGILIVGPLLCGFYYIIFQRMKGQQATTGDLFKGFDVLWDALLAWVIIFAVTFIVGLVPFLGIILSLLAGAPFIFVFPLIWEKRLSFIDAIKESLQLFKERWSDLLPFYVVASLVGAAGVLVFARGMNMLQQGSASGTLGILLFSLVIFILTFPIYLYSTACLYRAWVGLGNAPVSSEPRV